MSERIEELPAGAIESIDEELAELKARWGLRAFSEVAMSGLPKGRGALLLERQIQLNDLARQEEGGI